jgi:hypothetical protein
MNPLCIALLFHQMSPKIIQKVNIKKSADVAQNPQITFILVLIVRSMLNGCLLGKTFSKTNSTRLLYTLHRCENSHHKFKEYNECFSGGFFIIQGHKERRRVKKLNKYNGWVKILNPRMLYIRGPYHRYYI